MRDDLIHHSAQPLLSHLFGKRINGNDAGSMQVFHFNGFPIGAVHYKAAKILIDLAGDRDGVILFETIRKPRLVEK